MYYIKLSLYNKTVPQEIKAQLFTSGNNMQEAINNFFDDFIITSGFEIVNFEIEYLGTKILDSNLINIIFTGDEKNETYKNWNIR